jgi:hypothetical protein
MKEEDPNWVMGFQLVDNRINKTISLSHSQYIDTLLKRFQHEDCIPISTPMEPGLHLTKNDCPQTPEEIEDMCNVPYRQLVGALLWTSLVCNPQISQAVHQVARFGHNPG